MPSERLLQAIAVTAELTGTQLSAPAAKVLVDDLAKFPEAQVLGALARCRKELRGRMVVADVIARLDDGRPGAEESWAHHVPKNEDVTVVWTDEIREAWGIALPLLKEEDEIPARMAFKEKYIAAVQRARDEGRPVSWSASLGHDAYGRESVLLEAVEKGRLSAQHVAGLLPYRDQPNPRIQELMDATKKKQLESARDRSAVVPRQTLAVG